MSVWVLDERDSRGKRDERSETMKGERFHRSITEGKKKLNDYLNKIEYKINNMM